MKWKRILLMGDLHCGHLGGLTPPLYRTYHEDWKAVQETCWNFYIEKTKGKFDGCIITGDMIDGKSKFTGGRGLGTTDRQEQAEWAVDCIKHIETPHIAMVYGSPYHVGKDELFEKQIAEKVGAEIDHFVEIDLFGRKIVVRHKIGRSLTPVGGDIMMRKMALNDLVWYRDHDIKPADIRIFGHAHYFRHIQDASFDIIILPSLQAWTEFGASQCQGVVHFGVAYLHIREDGVCWFEKHLMKLDTVTINKKMEW